MPSRSLLVWQTTRTGALADLEAAYRLVLATGGGRRRAAAQQLKQAYVSTLSSQFQGYCRDLHRECIDALVQSITPATMAGVCEQELLSNRKLDRGNPNAGNLGADFGRLGVSFWPDVEQLNPRHVVDKNLLDDLARWRNAIAHQDFKPLPPGGTVVRLPAVRAWHRACNRLAVAFDEVMRLHIQTFVGSTPW